MPFILWRPFLFVWRWWRINVWLSHKTFILLEIKIPEEVLKPIRAMETVLDGLRQILYQPPDWWEKWIEGQVDLSYGLEIASLGGEPHFFVRIPQELRDSVESTIYSQYPEAEITQAEDYTKTVPSDIPNKEWDLWGADYRLLKPDPYPIKTYPEFETEREALEEKRIDPVAGLLEAMGKVKPGEQLWIQITATPATNIEIPLAKEGEEIRDKLAKRNGGGDKKRPILMEAADVLITGKVAEEKEEPASAIPPEMHMTPGERDIVQAIERKISKPFFDVGIRFIYLGRKDVFFKAKLRLPFAFFASFFTENRNALVPWGKTLTKIHKSWFLPLNLVRSRRVYLRKRRLFRNYVQRVNPLFPRKGGTYCLNTEELASLFHFPGRGVAPAPFISRIESKKGEPPAGLPSGM